MRKSDEYRTRLEQIDGKLRRARQGRGRRREQMLMLLDQLEAQYQRQKQELTSAWAEIDRLETLVEGLEDRLEKIADEFEKDSRQTDELIGRIARMDGVLKHVGKVRKEAEAEAPQRPAARPAGTTATPAAKTAADPQQPTPADAARPKPPIPPAAQPRPAPVPPPTPPRPAPTDGTARANGPDRNSAGDAVAEQERPMPPRTAELAGYTVDPTDPLRYARILNRKA